MLFSVLKKLCNENNISIFILEKEIGVANGSIRKWEKSTPSADKVLAVAKYFGVSVDYLLTGKAPGDLPSDPTEKTIIQKFRDLDETGRRTVQFLLDAEINRLRQIRVLESNGSVYRNIIPLRRSLQKASAGRGAYLGAEEFEIIYVTETPLTRRASFIIPVTGDSMLPAYHDGDQLLVERADDIEVGEIGIFTVDGDGFVKQRGENELISLNPDFPNIPLTEESWCNGRVIGVLKESDIK